MRRKKKKRTPPPPPDPENYSLIRTREGDYWRRKRGSVKPARLNEAFERNANAIRIVSPIGKRIRKKLAPFTKDLDTGRIGAYINGVLTKTYNQTGEISYEALKDLELNSSPLDIFVHAPIQTKQENGKVEIRININPHTIREQHNRAVGFLFESVLLMEIPGKKTD